MQTVNIHQAKTHLSRLIAKAVAGEPFVIAKSGKPLVKVTALNQSDASTPPKRHWGLLAGQITVPDDFDTMSGKEIADLFEDRDK